MKTEKTKKTAATVAPTYVVAVVVVIETEVQLTACSRHGGNIISRVVFAEAVQVVVVVVLRFQATEIWALLKRVESLFFLASFFFF